MLEGLESSLDGIDRLDFGSLADAIGGTKPPIDKTPVVEELEEETDDNLIGASAVTLGEEDDEDETGDSVQDSPETPGAYKLVAEILKEKGVIGELPAEFEESDDFLANLVDEAKSAGIKDGIEDYKNSLPEHLKYLISAHNDGVDTHGLLEKEAAIQDYMSITDKDLEDDGVKKAILTDFYTKQGLNVTKISSKIEKLEASGIMEDEAKDALETMVRQEKKEKADMIVAQKAQRIEDDKLAQKRMKDLEDEIISKKEVIPGLEWSKEDKRKIYAALTKPVGKTKDGRSVNAIGKYMEENPDFKYVVADLIVLRGGKFDAIKAKLNADITNKTKGNLANTATTKLSSIDYNVLKKALKIK